MNMKSKLHRLNSLHVQITLALLFVCMVPLGFVSFQLSNGYYIREQQETRRQVSELCADFSNRILNTGYLTNTAQTELSSAMNMAAQIFNGRILVVNSELQILKDTFGREEGRIIISEEIVRAMQGRENTYEHMYEDTTEIICQITDSSGTTVLGCVVFIYMNPEKVPLYEDISRTTFLMNTILVVLVLCFIFITSARMVFPMKQLAFNLRQQADGILEERIEVKGNYEVESVVESVNNMLDDMRDTERRRQEFVSNVSHELKTPLTSMKVLAESLVDQQGVPEELYQEFLHDINNEIDRETQIITDLLNLVRLDRKEGEMQIAQVSINELLEIVMRRLRPIAKTRNVEMIFESFRNVLAEVDEVKMSLVFTNLIENAIKYNKEGGMVKVSLNADHKFFYVRVEDTGLGIPEDAKKFIFDRFYRVDKARSRETGGTGLGLAITKSAVMMHKGNIKVSGKEGEGSVFVVRIPLNFIPDYAEE